MTIHNCLLSGRTSNSCANPRRAAEVGTTVGVPVDLLRHGVSVAVASTGRDRSSMEHVPDFRAVRAVEEAVE
jgi:hypothetical protein